MVDIASLQKEYVSSLKDMKILEVELRKRRDQVSALYTVIKAYGGEPEKTRSAALGEEDEDSLSLHLPPGAPTPTLPEAIKKAIPTQGQRFGIEDILKTVRRQFPMVKSDKIAGILWRFSKQGLVKTLNKGTRGNPAQYASL